MPSVKNQEKRDIDGINGKFNENKTKCNSHLLHFEEQMGSGRAVAGVL